MPANTIKVYISGYREYRIDNPAALVDAGKFVPEQFDPDHNTPLAQIDPRVWEELGNSLIVQVATGTTHKPIPGVINVDNKISYSLRPPKGQPE